MTRGNPNIKNINKEKKWNIIGRNKYGFIEALNMVDGVYRSFNIFIQSDKAGKALFYKSCYKHSTAMRLLGNYK